MNKITFFSKKIENQNTNNNVIQKGKQLVSKNNRLDDEPKNNKSNKKNYTNSHNDGI